MTVLQGQHLPGLLLNAAQHEITLLPPEVEEVTAVVGLRLRPAAPTMRHLPEVAAAAVEVVLQVVTQVVHVKQ